MLKVISIVVFIVGFPVIIYADTQCVNTNAVIAAKTSHLQDNNDGTITDSKTDLMWKKCSEGQSWNADANNCDGVPMSLSWSQALQQSSTINMSTAEQNLGLGYTDWRLPNIKELYSIVEHKCYYPSINEAVFSSSPTEGEGRYSLYWSSTQQQNSGSNALIVNFGGPVTAYQNKNNAFVDLSYTIGEMRIPVRAYYYARLVRNIP
jgi:hypothetical protein